MVNLDNLIQVYENSLDESICNFLIDTFENLSEYQEKINNDLKPSFTQFNLTAYSKLSKELEEVHNHVIRKTIEHRNSYYDFIDDRVFPESHSFEQFRIKRYNNDGQDQFNTHVDVQDYESARRFLTFIWYLNNVEEGGETEFINMKVSPKRGSLVVFPPLWMFPHRGLPPISNKKYILHTYLHYK